MAKSQIHGVLEQLKQAAGDGAGLTDGQLLECFVAGREEIAFEALVRRHGTMVLGVSRRVLGRAQDAEDAFQAAFLVLARKAAAVWRRQKIGNWLYGVAFRIALKARSAGLKRQAKDKQGSSEPSAPATETGHEWLAALDRELSGLPAKYRVPIVLCDLQGQSRHDAARQLGWREGTLSVRLSRARALLEQRLTRRGFTLTAAALIAALSTEGAAPVVPAALAASTVKAAGFRAIKQAVAAGAISARVASLTEGVLRSMMWSKLKTGVVGVLALAVVATGLGRALYSASGKSEPSKGAKTVHQDGVETTKAFTRKVYPVAKLIGEDDEKNARDLIKVIKTIEPASWNPAGALGTIDYFPGTKSIVVRQSAEVHREIAELLRDLEEK